MNLAWPFVRPHIYISGALLGSDYAAVLILSQNNPYQVTSTTYSIALVPINSIPAFALLFLPTKLSFFASYF